MTSNFEEALTAFIKVELHINQLRIERREALKHMQAICEHTSIVECAHLESASGMFKTLPPRRVCRDCGLAEDGWGSGYQKLTSKPVAIVTRDCVYKLTN